MPFEQSAVNGESMDSSGDGLGTFLFTSESVGEGHPGEKNLLYLKIILQQAKNKNGSLLEN